MTLRPVDVAAGAAAAAGRAERGDEGQRNNGSLPAADREEVRSAAPADRDEQERARLPHIELDLCPITRQPLREPVLLADGHIYEREAIEEWLRRPESRGRSPMTNLELPDLTLVPAAEALRERRSALGGGRAAVDGGMLQRALVAGALWSAWAHRLNPLGVERVQHRLQRLHRLDRWALMEKSAACVGLNRSRRVRVARQLDSMESSVLDSLTHYTTPALDSLTHYTGIVMRGSLSGGAGLVRESVSQASSAIATRASDGVSTAAEYCECVTSRLPSIASRLPSSKPTVQALVSLGVVLQTSIVSTASAVAVGWPAASDSEAEVLNETLRLHALPRPGDVHRADTW